MPRSRIAMSLQRTPSPLGGGRARSAASAAASSSVASAAESSAARARPFVPGDPVLDRRPAAPPDEAGLVLAPVAGEQRLEAGLEAGALAHDRLDHPRHLVEDRRHRAEVLDQRHAPRRRPAAPAPGSRRRPGGRRCASRRSTAWDRPPGRGRGARRAGRRARASAGSRTAPGRCPGTRRPGADRCRAAPAPAPRGAARGAARRR